VLMELLSEPIYLTLAEEEEILGAVLLLDP
jgi:hypothetical protein